jgi:hypothetical protein
MTRVYVDAMMSRWVITPVKKNPNSTLFAVFAFYSQSIERLLAMLCAMDHLRQDRFDIRDFL